MRKNAGRRYMRCSCSRATRIVLVGVTIREIASGDALQYLMFKFVGGMVNRYHQQNVTWAIGKAQSGGPPLLNLGSHFVGLAVTGAIISPPARPDCWRSSPTRSSIRNSCGTPWQGCATGANPLPIWPITRRRWR